MVTQHPGDERVGRSRNLPCRRLCQFARRVVEELDDDAAAGAALRVVPFKCMWTEVQACAGIAFNHFANALVSIYDFLQSARFKTHANDHTPVHLSSQ